MFVMLYCHACSLIIPAFLQHLYLPNVFYVKYDLKAKTSLLHLIKALCVWHPMKLINLSIKCRWIWAKIVLSDWFFNSFERMGNVNNSPAGCGMIKASGNVKTCKQSSFHRNWSLCKCRLFALPCRGIKIGQYTLDFILFRTAPILLYREFILWTGIKVAIHRFTFCLFHLVKNVKNQTQKYVPTSYIIIKINDAREYQ